MRYRFKVLCLLLAFSAYGFAQSGQITSNQCVSIDVSQNASTVGIQVTGTWSGTLQPQVSIQGQAPQNTTVAPSTSPTSQQNTITANGVYYANVGGAGIFYVCGNTVASGAANVYLNRSTGVNASLLGGGGGGGGGSVTSVGSGTGLTGGPITTTGSLAVAANGITNSLLAQMAANTLKGNNTGSPGNAVDLTAAQVATLLGLGPFATQASPCTATQGCTGVNTSASTGVAQVASGTWSVSTALTNGTTATTQAASDATNDVATDNYVNANPVTLTQLGDSIVAAGQLPYVGSSGATQFSYLPVGSAGAIFDMSPSLLPQWDSNLVYTSGGLVVTGSNGVTATKFIATGPLYISTPGAGGAPAAPGSGKSALAINTDNNPYWSPNNGTFGEIPFDPSGQFGANQFVVGNGSSGGFQVLSLPTNCATAVTTSGSPVTSLGCASALSTVPWGNGFTSQTGNSPTIALGTNTTNWTAGVSSSQANWLVAIPPTGMSNPFLEITPTSGTTNPGAPSLFLPADHADTTSLFNAVLAVNGASQTTTADLAEFDGTTCEWVITSAGILQTSAGSNCFNAAITTSGTIPLLATNSFGVPVAASAHGVSAALKCADSSGSGTAQTCTTSPSFTPATNDCIEYTTTTTNSGTGLTVNVDALGAKSIAIPGSSGWTTTLTASIIPANKPLLACYDGTNWNVQQTGTVPVIPLSGLATQAANTVVANVTGSTASPTAAAIPSGIQNYVAGTGYNQGTAHQIEIALACADSSGSGTAQSCTTSPSFTPAAGDCVIYTTTTANSGTGLTLNVNSLGAKSVAKWQTTSTLAANDVGANTVNLTCYDGTNWEIDKIGNAPSGGGGGGNGSAGSNGTGIVLTGSSYAPVFGNYSTIITTDTNAGMALGSVAQSVSKLSVVLGTAIGAGQTLVVSLCDITVSSSCSTLQAVTCTVPNSGTSCTDTTHSYSVPANDIVVWKMVLSSTTATSNIAIGAVVGSASTFSGNTSTAVSATSNVATAPANDLLTADGSGNAQDSGYKAYIPSSSAGSVDGVWNNGLPAGGGSVGVGGGTAITLTNTYVHEQIFREPHVLGHATINVTAAGTATTLNVCIYTNTSGASVWSAGIATTGTNAQTASASQYTLQAGVLYYIAYVQTGTTAASISGWGSPTGALNIENKNATRWATGPTGQSGCPSSLGTLTASTASVTQVALLLEP